MARIRSVHPGLFTDESFVSCSPLARLLLLGLWTEADDQGVFEWKPVTLKMRLLPVDSADVPALLSEMEQQNIVRRFEVAGKLYGAVRNFRKYQRPKSPSAIHPLPNELRSYVRISETEAPEPAQFPQSGEIPAQMEDGGEGEGEKEDTASAASSSASAPEIDLIEAERRCAQAAGVDRLGSFAPIAELLHRQADLERDVLPVIRARPAAGGKVSSWKFYAPIIVEAIAKRGPVAAPQGPPPVFVIEGSPEFRAWQEAEPGKHRAIQMKAGLGCYVPSRFPPSTPISKGEAA